MDRLREGSGRPAQMNDILVQLIVVAVLANVVLLLAALIVPRLRRPSRPLAAASPGPSLDAMSVGPIAVSAMPAVTAPTPPRPEAQGDSSTTMQETEDTQRQRRFFLPRDDEYPTPESVEAFLSAGQRREDASPMVDEQTGLETGFAWEMAVEREERRVARYGKSVTVVVAELDRLEALAARLGSENADRLVAPVATTLRHLARSADLVARTGHARFQVLMPETDEVQAINYVERIRDACDMWLDASAVSVRLVVGWAGAGSGVTIRDATRLAEQRMHADRARSGHGRGRLAVTAVPGRAGGAPASETTDHAAPTSASAVGEESEKDVRHDAPRPEPTPAPGQAPGLASSAPGAPIDAPWTTQPQQPPEPYGAAGASPPPQPYSPPQPSPPSDPFRPLPGAGPTV